MESQEVSSQDVEEHNSLVNADQGTDQSRTVTQPVSRSVDWSIAVDNRLVDEDVMHISGAGHWFLEGWIGDHAVDFLVDFCGIIRIICQRMQMGFCGGNGVLRYLNYNYWYQNQEENGCSWLIMPPSLEVI